MSDLYQDDDSSTYDSESEPSVVQGTLEGWAHLANCKGYAKLFFGKPAERPQARVRRAADGYRRSARDLQIF